ncbi:diacylglycerol/lipid kinase family protein [Nocardioides bruguierae]|uniref:Diacylglycerol kinase n=1 Tax=Nocardioides bruguierae TaxID=2945102 RepID=A0A9X2D864_9ACTN|nr:diacylglycerol kinase family protein [Nocardioides bruguierae]MCM0620945.1 diacylglycerol kinase [Nocardioides bruguierae]
MSEPQVGVPVVVVNPIKVEDLEEVRSCLAAVAAELGVPEPRLVETTEDDPGFGQTRDAVDSGASVVCALGGDGTVRAVAQELAGSGVPLGLLPGGTGNLLARNLDLPVTSLGDAARVALGSSTRTIDLGWLVADPAPGQSPDLADPQPPAPADNVHAFAVMAGLGFDAHVMDDAPEDVKAKAGWAAYVASGAQHLIDDPFDLEVWLDGGEPSHVEARTVVVGSCGELTGGVVLLPDAEVDDGCLDVAVLTPKGLFDWVGTAARVLVGHRKDGPSLERSRAKVVHLRTPSPQPCEVDGDVLGEATETVFVVQPGALVVRA